MLDVDQAFAGDGTQFNIAGDTSVVWLRVDIAGVTQIVPVTKIAELNSGTITGIAIDSLQQRHTLMLVG